MYQELLLDIIIITLNPIALRGWHCYHPRFTNEEIKM